MSGEIRTTGQVDFDQTRIAHVSPRVSGRVHRVEAVLGQRVVRGQVLAELDSIELGLARAEYLRAKAAEELARATHERFESLRAEGVASDQQVLESATTGRQALAELAIAAETLRLYGLEEGEVAELELGRGGSLLPLRAPFAGTIVDLHATLGELVTPERNLFTLADLGRVWIWIDVYQRDLGGVHLEDEARARVDAFPEEVFKGTVSYLSARVDADTRTVRARLDVENSEGKLRPGMFVEVELLDPHSEEGGAAGPSLPVVPVEAVVRDGDEAFVFLAMGEHRFERRQLRLGRRSAGRVEVLSGLEGGEEVVVEGAFVLKSTLAEESLGGGHSH
ncbi:MAG: efflux RND transporter periplasmic adaptor subunit [Acidobacteria bacterium]|nr:efflux RND transporter periplasmic adaptor subunit [Acidobacteriota bacterium]